jgi:hypothetical protein
MPSEMSAMNNTLLLLNALALAVLVVFHFQPAPAAAEQQVELATTYTKPPKPQAQIAVMTGASRVSPQANAEHPATSGATVGKGWVF